MCVLIKQVLERRLAVRPSRAHIAPPHPRPVRSPTRTAGPGTQCTCARLCFLYSSARLFSRSCTKARSRAVGKVTTEG